MIGSLRAAQLLYSSDKDGRSGWAECSVSLALELFEAGKTRRLGVFELQRNGELNWMAGFSAHAGAVGEDFPIDGPKVVEIPVVRGASRRRATELSVKQVHDFRSGFEFTCLEHRQAERTLTKSV
jgi:hypothetical protein